MSATSGVGATIEQMAEPPSGNRYWSYVDESADNNAHAYAFELIGYSKRVLELGPAAGHVTRVLVERGCEVVGIEYEAEAAAALEGVAECIVGDLSDPSIVAKAAAGRTFDVVLAGDVLEHLPDPTAVLQACREVLSPNGYVVISLPNVAHADVALALLDGRFRYNEVGLLDRTHLRFFTKETIQELLERTGFQMLDLRRVLRPVFETELGVDPADYAPEVVEHVLANPEAETYQFVVRAVPHGAESEISALADRAIAADEAARRERIERIAAEAKAAELAEAHAALEAELADVRERLDLANRHLDLLFRSKTMRAVAPFRAVYGKFRQLTR
jgi:2-polyprenyl-3-methyl-5-hydroxy-6-metoxy-1,4-benzoquinol methylase